MPAWPQTWEAAYDVNLQWHLKGEWTFKGKFAEENGNMAAQHGFGVQKVY